MALNEHKNLDDTNLHVPKGFASAGASTVLTKNASSEVEWTNISNTGFGQVLTFKMQGYSTSNAGLTYEFGQLLTDAQTPFEMAQDYGSTTVGGAVFTTSGIFRTGQGFVAPSNLQISNVRGWITGNNTTNCTVALCKVTPVNGASEDLTPVLLDEIVGATSGNTVMVQINETAFTVDTLTAGDIFFPMVKAGQSSTTIYFNLTIQAIITT